MFLCIFFFLSLSIFIRIFLLFCKYLVYLSRSCILSMHLYILKLIGPLKLQLSATVIAFCYIYTYTSLYINIYIYILIYFITYTWNHKTMCHSSFHENGLVTIHVLWHMRYRYRLLVPMKYLHMHMYISEIYLVTLFSVY